MMMLQSNLFKQPPLEDNHLSKTPMLSLPKQISMQLLLWKMISCLTQSVTTFVTQIKKTCLKQPLQNFT